MLGVVVLLQSFDPHEQSPLWGCTYSSNCSRSIYVCNYNLADLMESLRFYILNFLLTKHTTSMLTLKNATQSKCCEKDPLHASYHGPVLSSGWADEAEVVRLRWNTTSFQCVWTEFPGLEWLKVKTQAQVCFSHLSAIGSVSCVLNVIYFAMAWKITVNYSTFAHLYDQLLTLQKQDIHDLGSCLITSNKLIILLTNWLRMEG